MPFNIVPFFFQYWSSRLRSLIRKCYDHANATFLIEFSRRLMLCMEKIGKIYTEDNGDGTRSMRTASSQKLLVTFRAENQDYDKFMSKAHFSTSSPLKGMFVSSNNCSDPALPKSADVFLCDICGSDFQSLACVEVR